MELRHLRYFVAVAEELHFGRAAARLHIAQPPLSQQIRDLERELGAALFTRTTRRVELTAAGRVLLAEARHLFEQTERTVRAVQRASRGEVGHLAIGFVPSADLDILPRVLSRWRVRFPHVEIELHAMLSGPQVEALRHGRIQVGFLRLPVDDGGLAVDVIQREHLVAALPEGHRLARRSCVRLADLQHDGLIMFPRWMAPSYYDLLVSVCRHAGFTPQVLHETENMQTNLGLVAAGLGVSLHPASIRNLQRAGVVYRPLAPPLPIEMAVAYARDDRSATLQAFLHVLAEIAPGTRAPRGTPGKSMARQTASGRARPARRVSAAPASP
jgi:DNA-binding transcriptional LysR family regulator